MSGKRIVECLGLCAVLCAFLPPSVSFADLEWITGGVPKSSPDRSETTVVKDAPEATGGPVAGGNQDIIIGHLTTCTKVVNQYPVDSVNFFYPAKHPQVSYFAYFMLRPSSRIHRVVVECFAPVAEGHAQGKLVARYEREYKVGFTDNLLTVNNETYQWFLIDMVMGMEHPRTEYGQVGLPRDLGLYTVHLTVDGQLAGITFFYVKPEDAKTPSAIPTLPPASKSSSMPMSTPVSTAPLRLNSK